MFFARQYHLSFCSFNIDRSVSQWPCLGHPRDYSLIKAWVVAMSSVCPWKFQESKLCFLISLHNMDANHYVSSTCRKLQWPESNVILPLQRPHTTMSDLNSTLFLFIFFTRRSFVSVSLFRSTWDALCPFSTRISRQRECSFVRVNIVYTAESGSWLILRKIKKCLLSLRLWGGKLVYGKW